MIRGKSVLAVIPARGGSKRLPRKNVLPLSGKPLIAWTIEAALECSLIDKCIVSTDDNEIAEVASGYGAQVIFRPAELSSDVASSIDVVVHVIKKLEQKYDYVIFLQPTSPLRTACHIRQAFDRLIEKSADAIVSVTECVHSPLWTNTLPDDGSMDNFMSADLQGVRSQDLPKYYQLNGAIFLISTEQLLMQRKFILEKNCYSLVMDNNCSIDIDTQLDFDIARILLKN